MNQLLLAQQILMRDYDPKRGEVKPTLKEFREWIESLTPPELDLERIRIPPPKRYFFSVNWRKRYAFEFLIPKAEVLFEQRRRRKKEYGTHHVDKGVNLKRVENQIMIYQMAALHMCREGLITYIREGTDGVPLEIIESESG